MTPDRTLGLGIFCFKDKSVRGTPGNILCFISRPKEKIILPLLVQRTNKSGLKKLFTYFIKTFASF